MTVDWWDDLWLNEGFATYIEYKGIHAFEPEWETDAMFLLQDLYRVMDLDATFASHPIVTKVETPDQINAVFDVISYCKGASVIRMMEDFMGDVEFRKGLKDFLVKFSYKTAVTKDLLDCLTKVSSSGLDVAGVMDTWTRQKGYPVLEVSCEKESSAYTVRQERFLADPDADSRDDEKSAFGYRWEVPLTYITDKCKEKKLVWMHKDGSPVDM